MSLVRKGVARRPILVTGCPRSGTTWTGRMLSLAPGVDYLHEPFNPDMPPGYAGAIFSRYLQYVCTENEAAFRPALARTVGFHYHTAVALRQASGRRDLRRIVRDEARLARARITRRRALVKDPIAVFSAEWLADTFDMQVVVLVRHPAAVTASFKRLGWRHDFRSFLDQPLLMEAFLEPHAQEIRDAADGRLDAVEEAALLWRCINQAVLLYRERRPDWIVRRHEDLAAEPLDGLTEMFGRLDLELTPSARAEILAHSSPDNPGELSGPHGIRLASRETVRTWRRILDDDEVRRVRERAGAVGEALYGDADW